ncbi:hypothetical protein STAS_30248 [Striga asiatica]|uniref:Transmembrane protein n=1 Tax=Striga asiatica TaxID=4170 RepID=A0A5A7R5R8_STRAF|nr:hypothetical protein STAS_30248 [Striga asiatica]
MEPKPLHPLHQIAQTPSHKLLLKQWLKEEELILGRLSLKESQIDSARNQLTLLYSLFFLFHSVSILLLFSSSAGGPHLCRGSWVPCLCSFLCSMGFIWAVRYKTDVECHVQRLLDREKEDYKLLGKCVGELKRKGLEFDLMKEVDALRRAKSLRAGPSPVNKWSVRDFGTLFLFAMACCVLGLMRLILCVTIKV